MLVKKQEAVDDSETVLGKTTTKKSWLMGRMVASAALIPIIP